MSVPEPGALPREPVEARRRVPRRVSRDAEVIRAKGVDEHQDDVPPRIDAIGAPAAVGREGEGRCDDGEEPPRRGGGVTPGS